MPAQPSALTDLLQQIEQRRREGDDAAVDGLLDRIRGLWDEMRAKEPEVGILLFNQAVGHVNAGRLEAAAAILRWQLRLPSAPDRTGPLLADCVLRLARGDIGAGRWEAAEERLRSAFRLLPAEAPVAGALTAVMRRRLADHAKTSAPDAFAELARALVCLDPGDVLFHSALADVSEAGGDLAGARTALRRAAALLPGQTVLLWQLATVSRALGRRGEVADALRRLPGMVLSAEGDGDDGAGRVRILRPGSPRRPFQSLPENRIAVRLPSGERAFAFNRANFQFHSVYDPRFEAHGYEPETAILIDILLPRDGVFFDIGANWGHFSIFAASGPGFRGEVHAFEPQDGVFADLRSTVGQLGLDGVVRCFNMGLSDADRDDVHMLHPGTGHSGIARVADGPPVTVTGADWRREGSPIRLRRLDSLDAPPPHLIKIDAEDHESQVLRGGRATIERSRPFILFESWVGAHNQDNFGLMPFAMLSAMDYVVLLAAFHEESAGGPALVLEEATTLDRFVSGRDGNYLACPRERLDALGPAA